MNVFVETEVRQGTNNDNECRVRLVVSRTRDVISYLAQKNKFFSL